MAKIEIFEQDIENGKTKVGKLAIIRGGLQTDNPTALMNAAVSQYVGEKGYNEFVEVYLDNPWVRIIVSNINGLDYKTFDDQKL